MITDRDSDYGDEEYSNEVGGESDYHEDGFESEDVPYHVAIERNALDMSSNFDYAEQ